MLAMKKAASPEKEVRYVAAGYAIYSLMFFGIGGFILTLMGWRGSSRFFENLEIVGGTLLLMLSCGVINLLMAFGSWRVLSYKGWKKMAVLIAAVGIAALLVLSNITGLVAWAMGRRSMELGYIQIVSPLVITAGYVLLAGLLVRTVLISNKARQPTEESGG
jgi:hypothetical protein